MVFDKFHIFAVLATMLVVILAVLSHYDGLRYFTTWMTNSRLRPRLRIALMIYGLLLLHTLETITAYAGDMAVRNWLLGAGQ